MLQGTFNFGAQDFFVKQVPHADTDTVDFVGVAGSNSAPGRADAPLTKEPFGDLVHGAVVGRDDVCGPGDQECGGVHTACF